MAKLRVNKIAAVGVSTETTGSVFFDGTGDILISRSDGLAPEHNDYTAEGWVNVPSTTGLTTCRFFGTGEKTALLWTHSSSANPDSIPTSWNRTDVGVGTYSAGELYTTSDRTFIFDLGEEVTSITFDFSRDLNNSWYYPAWYVSQGSVATWTNKGAVATDGDGIVTVTDSTPFRYIGLRSLFNYQGLVATIESTTGAPGADTTSWGFKRDSSDGNLKFYDGGSWVDVGASISEDTWYHLAMVRKSNALTVYVDGAARYTEEHTNNLSKSSISIGGAGINTVGDSTVTDPLRGYVSNVRLTMGALYTGDFTPPTTELDVVAGTAFVGCYDGTNTFAEKTHKSLFSLGDRSSTPTLSATDSPIGISTFNPGLLRTDPTAGPVFQGGAGFASQNWLTLPKGTTTDRNRTGGRGLHMGGGQSPYTNAIDYITITSMGNSVHFGDLTVARGYASAFSSTTRGICAGGLISKSNVIDYVNIASTGDAVDFGDLTLERTRPAGCSNSTRGFSIAGRNVGGSPYEGTNLIDYVTMATLGNAQDFGDLSIKRYTGAALSSPTRGIFGGGYLSELNTAATNNIEYITLSTLGDAVNFGDLLTKLRKANQALSSNTRGVFCGGLGSPALVNSIEYVTIATTGNTSDFGDASVSALERASCSNSLRGVLTGGNPNSSPNNTNAMDYITIASTGNSQDFGDLKIPADECRFGSGCSDSHGGLS